MPVDYTNWLSASTGKPYRLLTAAEWNRAVKVSGEDKPNDDYFNPSKNCPQNISDVSFREMQLKKYDQSDKRQYFSKKPSEEQISSVRQVIYETSNLCVDQFTYTSPVKHFKRNSIGIFDMTGNVSEWVQDCISPDDLECTGRKLKGMHYASRYGDILSTFGSSTFNSYTHIGIRVGLDE